MACTNNTVHEYERCQDFLSTLILVPINFDINFEDAIPQQNLQNCVYGPLPEHNNDGDSDGDEGLVHFHAEDRFGKAPMHVRHVYFQPATQNGRTRTDQRWR
jgi:hypothetical protein